MDPSVLGHLLLLQTSLRAAPDERRLLEMVAHGTAALPGVVGCVTCIRGNTAAYGLSEDGPMLGKCPAWTNPSGSGAPCCAESCPPGAERGWRRLGIATVSREYGSLYLKVRDPSAFELYAPLVANVAGLVAILIESARNRSELALLNESLDKQVRDRSQRLAESERRLREAQRLAQIGSLEGDIHHEDLWWSNELFALLGLTREEFAPSNAALSDLLHPDDRAPYSSALTACLESGQGMKGEFRARRSDGEWRDFETIVTATHDDQGRVHGWRGTMQDVTERRAAEEQRKSLELRVQQAQKLESLGVLAGGVAHDFNNLLTGIVGNADLALAELRPDSPARQNIEGITDAAARATDLARQMLAYSGRGRFTTERIDLQEVIEELVRLLETSISKSVVLRYRFADNLPAVEADATQIRQVFMNLIINASEAIGDQRGVISISTGAMDCDETYLSKTFDTDVLPGGPYVCAEVSDTGCGMDPETTEKIFDPFFTTKFTGRGLGLSAIQGIVRGHGGAIKVASEPDRGTTFKILFPAQDERVGPRIRRIVEPREWHGSGTILVVDDEEFVRAVSQSVLESASFTVITASDGQEALQIFRERADEFRCVLLDLTMPGIGGEETFHELRRIRADVAVILSSGYDEQDILQRFTDERPSGFVQKPYKPSRLIAKLREVLDLG